VTQSHLTSSSEISESVPVPEALSVISKQTNLCLKAQRNDGQDEIPRFLSTKGLVSICVGGQNNMLLLTNLPILFFPHLAPHT
jgi:hypothetical protein